MGASDFRILRFAPSYLRALGRSGPRRQGQARAIPTGMSVLPRAGGTRLRSAATALGGVVNRRAWALLLAGLAVLMAMTVLFADRKPLWNDELFTYYISRLPDTGDMWSELATGVEQTPISFYVITRASLELFGNGTVALRLPALLGYLLMCICVFRFVARRSSPLYGLVAVLFPIATVAHGYAYEARAYGLVLGFSAAALLCWQLTIEGPHRRLAALGTAVSLAAAVGSHYYAILLVIPLLVGEAVRSRAQRRVDWLVLASISGAFVPLALSAPLIAAAEDYSTTFWSLPSWTSAVRFYPNSLLDRELAVGIGIVLSAAALVAWRSSRGPARPAARLVRPPDHELAALVALMLLPFLAVALGKWATGAFTERSALAALIGVTILIAFAAWWWDGGVPIAGVSLLLILTGFAVARVAERYREVTAEAREQEAGIALSTASWRRPGTGGDRQPSRLLRAEPPRDERTRRAASDLPRRSRDGAEVSGHRRRGVRRGGNAEHRPASRRAVPVVHRVTPQLPRVRASPRLGLAQLGAEGQGRSRTGPRAGP